MKNFLSLYKKTLKNTLIDTAIKIFVGLLLLTPLVACQTFEELGIQTRDDVEKSKPSDEKDEETKVVGRASEAEVNQKLFNVNDENTRPKIGLILGPGLALSLSHLGVLKALNQEKLPVEVISGMGWSSLIAANYAIHGAVNDMAWKASQGQLNINVGKGFLSGDLKETSQKDLESVIAEYTRGANIQSSKIKFFCPSLNVNSVRTLFFRSGRFERALLNCMKTPPLTQSETRYWASLTEVDQMAEKMKKMGAQKIIFVSVLPRRALNWGKYQSAVPNRDKYFWAQVQESLSGKFESIDHTLYLDSGQHEVLNFVKSRRMIDSANAKGRNFFKNLARKYNF